MIKSLLYPSASEYRAAAKTRMRRMDGWQRIAAATFLLVLAAALFGPTVSAQLQQSGGGGSNASVGAVGGTAPTSGTLSGGTYNSTLPTLTSGQMGSEQLDSSARQIVVGAGVAGTPTGGVLSVQGAASGTALPVSGTFWQATQPVSGTVSINAIPTGTAIIGKVVPATACGTTVESQALAAVPTSSTAVFTSTTCIMVIVLNNTNSSAATVTVTDNEGTPVNDVLTFSIPASSQLIQPLYGVAFTSGLKWTASTSGVTGAILGYQ
jgi:hypothetical protein